MITPEKAVEFQTKEFQNKKTELENIVDEQIKKTFQMWKTIVEVKNSTAVNIFNSFEALVKEYYKKNNRNITRKTFKQYGPRCDDSYDDYMLQLEPIKKSNNYLTEIPIVWNWPRSPMDH